MPLDTSSYYPEVPGQDPEDKEESPSLNSREIGLFAETTLSEPEMETPSSEILHTEKSLKKQLEEEPGDSEKLLDFISHFLSWVLVPLLMPTYGLILAFGLSVLDVVPMAMRVRFVFITLGISFAIPVLMVLLLKILGLVKDVGLNGQKERLIPYIITAICFGATGWFMAMRGAPLWLIMFFTGGALATVVNLLVNIRWKISAHAAAIAGVIALLIRMERDTVAQPELLIWLLITIGLTGLLGSARVWLGRHTVWQVLAGYVVGFCSVFFLMGIK